RTGGVLKKPLSGPAFNGRTPSGEASADDTQFSGCGGFSLLTVQVEDVNLPDGTQLWVTLALRRLTRPDPCQQRPARRRGRDEPGDADADCERSVELSAPHRDR